MPDRDPVLGLEVRPHRVDGRDDGARALDHGSREVRIVEVTDPLLDARECRGGAGTSYDGTHGRAPFDQRRAGAGANQAVRSGDHDDGGRGGARRTHATTLTWAPTRLAKAGR